MGGIRHFASLGHTEIFHKLKPTRPSKTITTAINHPNMAGIFHHAISWLYTALALIAQPSLLTFLVAKLIVAAASTWIATADHGSPQGALVLLLFSATWLLHITRLVRALYSIVLPSAFIVLAASLEGADGDAGKNPSNDEGVRGGFTAALADLKEQSGTGLVEHMVEHPWFAFETLTTYWSAYVLLGMYVAAYAFGATRKVLTAPLEAWTRGGENLARFQRYREVETPVLVGERGKAGLAAN
ncbi:hypothetical protein CDEST_14839 [Colletotrichum destructivum]|uniref:Uncharacterized protein n=1 Tax=Colletotrichum destructivum TaxID=34406 RepID=A0AAX4J3B8_9PEZI|nr:hypothetical protein CDEST_14839 [Colletotrichum destructivum]